MFKKITILSVISVLSVNAMEQLQRARADIAKNLGRNPALVAKRQHQIALIEDLVNKYPTHSAYDLLFYAVKFEGLSDEKIIEFAKVLKDLGANLNQSVIGMAVLSKNTLLESLVKDLGLNPNARTDFGGTALHWAVDPNTVKLLGALGANPNAQNNEGETPLHKLRSVEVIKALHEIGADSLITNNKGQTPAQVAEIEASIFGSPENHKVVRLLREWEQKPR